MSYRIKGRKQMKNLNWEMIMFWSFVYLFSIIKLILIFNFFILVRASIIDNIL